MRVVSLVPSVTDTVAALGRAGALAGVTRYCTSGAPPSARVVGGTKNPDVRAVVELAPDVVLANAEENRAGDLDALREAGLDVRVTYPRTVDGARELLVELAVLLDADATALLHELDTAVGEAARLRPPTPLAALTLVWRKPWRGLGPGTYADDLLHRCGFANVLAGFDDPYPALDTALVLAPQVVLLPSEPYAFGDSDLVAVQALVPGARAEFVDGELLTWHGTRTAAALRAFTGLARRLAADVA